MHTEKIIIGIDPGKRGAIAIINSVGKYLHLFDLPYLDSLDTLAIMDELLIYFVRPFGDISIYIEKPLVTSARLKKPDGTGFNIGLKQVRTTFFNYGKLISIFELSGVKIVEISPQKWKNKFNLDDNKVKSVELARKLFPGLDNILLKSKDGRAEALLIAEYGRIYERG